MCRLFFEERKRGSKREKVRERENKIEGEASTDRPTGEGRVWLTLKLDELLWPLKFEVILYKIKYLRNYNISMYINFYQNRFINECARKKKAKIPEFQSFRVFFVRCRRTYVLNKWLKSTILSNLRIGIKIVYAVIFLIKRMQRKLCWYLIFRRLFNFKITHMYALCTICVQNVKSLSSITIFLNSNRKKDSTLEEH